MREQQDREQQKQGAHTSPRRSDQQDAPEPERLINPDEEAGQSIQELENPPQAEGDRDDV